MSQLTECLWLSAALFATGLAAVLTRRNAVAVLIGVELKAKVAPYLRALQAEGVLALPAGLNVLRFLPPAVITYEQIDFVVEKTAKVLAT
jgi:acetylornithine/LysW-gamma-L-lysine aminotransferase